MKTIRSGFVIADDAEVAIEVDPRTINEEKFPLMLKLELIGLVLVSKILIMTYNLPSIGSNLLI